MKTLLFAVVITLGQLAIGGASASAQQHLWIGRAPVPSAEQLKEAPETGLTTIFSSLGPKKQVYDASGGWIAAGPQDAYTGQQQDVAIPFTPAVNATVLQIKVPFQYYQYGVNAGTIELAADASGLPGTVLAKQDKKNFPVFGIGCCRLTTWKLKVGVPVTAGTQYWIIATTDQKSVDSAYVWDYNWSGTISPLAVQDGGTGWNVLTFLTSPAAGVFGTTP